MPGSRRPREKIRAENSLNHALSDIAGAMAALRDSHTFFVPPPRPYKHSYGWHMMAVGDSDCYITAVRPGSDAETRGIRPGDQVLTVNGFPANREDAWTINYIFNTLRPQMTLQLELRSPQGVERKLDVNARFEPTQRLVPYVDIWALIREQENREYISRPRWAEYEKRAVILKLPDFTFEPEHSDTLLNRISPYQGLILDLRGNPGGYVESLTRFLGGFFDHPVKVADRIGRKNSKPQLTKSRGGKTFTGKVVVLVDSESASAAELFARVIQLEHRGKVIGDRSSGKVMESQMYSHQSGLDIATFYGASITDANLLMTDGKSLENVGVVPDERLVPSGADLAAGRDPVLAHAAELLGMDISSEQAGKLFSIEWPK